MSITATGNKIKTTIDKAKNILLVIHQNPDADALGSLSAVAEWLDTLGKTHTAFCLGTSIGDCSFINEQRQLIAESRDLAGKNFDLLISLDSGDLEHAGINQLLPELNTKPTIINIDHHATNKNFGQINLVQTDSASTTEILYQLFKGLGVKISGRIASSLLAGIIYDTYGFTNQNTSAKSLEISSALLKNGAKLTRINETILKNKSLPALQLWGTILTRLSHNPNLNIATTIIGSDDLIGDKQDAEVTEGIANFLNNLTGVDAALVLRQEDKQTIKGSLRTNSDLIDVSRLAKIFGGGGHKKAAGFKIKGQLKQTKNGYWQII